MLSISFGAKWATFQILQHFFTVSTFSAISENLQQLPNFIPYHRGRAKPRIVILGHYIKGNLSYDLCPNWEMVVSYATNLVIRSQRTKIMIDAGLAREACRVCPQLTHICTEGLNQKYEWVRFINIANYWFLRLFEL